MHRILLDILTDTRQSLKGLGFTSEVTSTEKSTDLLALLNGHELKISIDQIGNKDSYGFYDATIVVRISGSSYLLNLSERVSDSILEDKKNINTVLKGLASSNYRFEKEKYFHFFSRTYMVVGQGPDASVYLLKTR